MAAQGGRVALERPRLHEVRAGAPTARRLHLLVASPGLFRHLTGQCLHRAAAFHHVRVFSEP